ncbi:protein yellow-like [Cloeon dipterum]|uniref:protein yellow-like n=1 Tax=Cloeon dipterum TaxID=197152 RepID=UPI0032209C89
MAVFRGRVFVSYSRYNGIPVTLAWFPTTSESSTPPQLNPFPSWQAQKRSDCKAALYSIRGLDIDIYGRLWAVDDGSDVCKPKLWIFDLNHKDSLKVKHEFLPEVVSSERFLLDLVVDVTPEDTFAYIADSYEQSTHIIAYSLNKDKSWRVETGASRIETLAISHSNIYVGGLHSNNLHAVRLCEIRAEIKKPKTSFIGKFSYETRRMVLDLNGRLYFDLPYERSIKSWDTNVASFKEEKFFKDTRLAEYYPFIFSLDEFNNLWIITMSDKEPKYKLMKYAVSRTKSETCTCNYTISTATTSTTTTEHQPDISAFDCGLNFTESGIFARLDRHQTDTLIISLMCSNGVTFLIMALIILFLGLKFRRMQNSIDQINKEGEEMSQFPRDDDESDTYDDVGPPEPLAENQDDNEPIYERCESESELYAEIVPQPGHNYFV